MQKLLIIAGTTRSGTTATYTYLRQHPAICASSIKETRYFLGDDINMPRVHPYSESAEHYPDFFRGSTPDLTWMEASPQYLYSAQTPMRLFKAYPQARLILLLREPISRLVSWYQFGQQKGMLERRLSFAEFIDTQHRELQATSPYPLRAMVEGRYSQFLACWLELFPVEQMLVLKFSDLKTNPREVMERITSFAGIENRFYADYQFEIHNDSFGVKSLTAGRLFSKLESQMQRWLRNSPIRPMLRAAWNRLIKPAYRHINATGRSGAEISDEVRRYLEEYYRDEPRDLARVLGIDTWEW